jgi:hypothetical protein
LGIDVATEVRGLNVLDGTIAINWLPFADVLERWLDLTVGNEGVKTIVGEGLGGGAENDEGSGGDLHLVGLFSSWMDGWMKKWMKERYIYSVYWSGTPGSASFPARYPLLSFLICHGLSPPPRCHVPSKVDSACSSRPTMPKRKNLNPYQHIVYPYRASKRLTKTYSRNDKYARIPISNTVIRYKRPFNPRIRPDWSVVALEVSDTAWGT